MRTASLNRFVQFRSKPIRPVGSEVVQVDNLGVARIALKLPIANLTKGVQKLRVKQRWAQKGSQ